MRIVALLILLFHWVAATTDGVMELLLVQTIWRHGDRSPTKTFPSDPFQEGNWTFGGGGFGQLSPIGMQQHMNLGMFLRKTYVDDMQFLSRRFRASEISVRSTNLNRTIISAMSNMVGMYGQSSNNNIPGEDYPNAPGWPPGYVPVAIHSVDYDTDYLGNPDAPCNRQTWLWNMAKSSDELQAFQNRSDVVSLLANLTNFCNETVDIDNLWIIRDALLIEQIHANDTLRKVNNWFTDDLFNKMTVINDQVDLYENGIFNGTLMMNNLDIGLELQKIRGGSMFNDINMHMNIKMDCLNQPNNDKCKWINALKYYVYSAHDTTIYSFFSILGIQSKVIEPQGLYPEYSAAMFVELWLNHTDNKPYFKLKYHQSPVNQTLFTITNRIDECHNQDYCSLDVFRSFAERCKPDQPMVQWCNVDPRVKATSVLSLGLLITMCAAWFHNS
ncbi:hypothetical protein Q1695_013507 [Nippostrongylus brasiliensis]|nr:hypothetical protein Q1695_013507 [Nippostrongylus brasiliensis]